MVRACGSYPQGQEFDSPSHYQEVVFLKQELKVGVWPSLAKAFALGAKDRVFESHYPDHHLMKGNYMKKLLILIIFACVLLIGCPVNNDTDILNPILNTVSTDAAIELIAQGEISNFGQNIRIFKVKTDDGYLYITVFTSNGYYGGCSQTLVPVK